MTSPKIIVITGATGGIGRAIATQFAEKKHRLMLADTDEALLSAFAHELSAAYGVDCSILAGDLADLAYARRIISETIARWQDIHVLVNNAAWRRIETMRTVGVEDWDTTLNVCLRAPAFLSKWAAAEMETRKTAGVIVQVSSVMSLRPAGYAPAYVAAKGALDTLTRELAITYGRSGIRVVGVAPGIIGTRMGEDYVDADGKNISSRLTSDLLDTIPLSRSGTAEDVARFIWWVCSADAGYLTGATIPIDGGFSSNFNTYSNKSLQFPDEF